MSNVLKGSEFDGRIEDPTSAGTWLDIGGLKSKTMTFNGESVDITNHGSNGWRQLLNGAGVNSIDASMEGVTNKVDSLKHIVQAWKERTHIRLQLRMLFGADNVLTIDVIAKITSIEFSGENDKEVPYSFSFQSADEPDMQIF